MQIEFTFKVSGIGTNVSDTLRDAVESLRCALLRWEFVEADGEEVERDPAFMTGAEVLE
jgi:hypothetical protein